MSTDEYLWYYSHDEENWELIGDVDRWGAIKYGMGYDDYFWICKASRHDFPYKELFQDLWDTEERMLENGYEDYWGEHQDSIFASDVSKEQEKDLQDRLIETFKTWTKDNDITLSTPWCFKDMKDAELIDIHNYCWVWTEYNGIIY